MSIRVNRNLKKYDFLGVMLSFFCGLHCFITPILIIYLPIVGEVIENTWFHTSMIGLMLFAFYQSIYKHFKVHHSKLILSLGIGGLCLFVVSYISELLHHFAEHEHGHELSNAHGDETSMSYVAIVGAVLLISAHILNIKKCRCLKGKGLCLDKG